MPRCLATAVCTLLVLVALSVPALAKEGAVTKFDSLPTDWHAGQTYTLGYTIKMDGVHPYEADTTAILASSLDGKTNLNFPGVGDATPGHYTAKVTFPVSGTYTWKVTQGSYFAPFPLGTISVLPALGTSDSAAAPSWPASALQSDELPFVVAGAAAFVLLAIARRRFAAVAPRPTRTT